MVREPSMELVAKPRDINSKTGVFVKLVADMGPDIPAIAKKMKEHKESVRYWYKKLLRNGFAVQASANYEKLGLRRVVAVVDFGPEYEGYAAPILSAMSKLCYLQLFVKTLPEGHYLVHGAVPEQHVPGWVEFMTRLMEMGLFASLQVATFDWVRNAPMKAEFFDFDEEKWDFQWSEPSKVYPDKRSPHSSARVEFDEVDLEIVKRMQLDANRSLVEMQKELGINYKTLSFHYRTHVMKRGMIKGYRINWMRTRYNKALEKAEHRRHTYQPIDILVKDVTEAELAELVGTANSLPFLWLEAGGPNYCAQLAFPTENMTEALQFLGRMLEPVKERALWFMADQTQALSFTIQPALYNQKARAWTFDQAQLLFKFQQLLLEIRQKGAPAAAEGK